MNLPLFIQNFFRSEFFRYGISGTFAFVCDFSILVAGTELLGLHYLVSNLGGYTVGLLVSYAINIRWVFRQRRFADRQHHEFLYFTTIVFVGLGISELVLYVATDFASLHYTLSKVVATIFVFLFNFVVKKWLLFS